ncbi:hypothetical protein CPB83DRAFT_836664 [Crepidotus variabilis]|uniref:BTB domain-containing protein n=1 Tax=Crepidotus variabilis TaxID=179855 RepID=A0A9P6EEG2_9AGAR|nr:hypothetical protein CPB83DRAFT_836664 [Crepidotus variabilis]
MANQPARKRTRQDSIEDDKSLVLIATTASRSPDYWFTDGSVVLQAELTQFRVHTSMLLLYSSVFRDKLRELETKELVEGCPVLHLSDSAGEVTNMLFGFYHSLVKKYDIEFQYKSGLEVMRAVYPSTLEKWYSRNVPAIFKYKTDIIDCINLALKLGIQSLLPAAYLTICHDFDLILNGARRPDGSHVQLPFHVHRVIIQGRDRMLKDEPHKTLAWITQPSADVLKHCLGPSRCSATRTQAMVYLYRHSHNGKFGFWNVNNALPQNTTSHQIHEKGCLEMWEDLPAYFGLPPWNDIIQ